MRRTCSAVSVVCRTNQISASAASCLAFMPLAAILCRSSHRRRRWSRHLHSSTLAARRIFLFVSVIFYFGVLSLCRKHYRTLVVAINMGETIPKGETFISR